MNYNMKKPLISFIIAISLLIIDGCRKDFEATAEHKATYGYNSRDCRLAKYKNVWMRMGLH